MPTSRQSRSDIARATETRFIQSVDLHSRDSGAAKYLPTGTVVSHTLDAASDSHRQGAEGVTREELLTGVVTVWARRVRVGDTEQ
jgi:hypothetical protein